MGEAVADEREKLRPKTKSKRKRDDESGASNKLEKKDEKKRRKDGLAVCTDEVTLGHTSDERNKISDEKKESLMLEINASASNEFEKQSGKKDRKKKKKKKKKKKDVSAVSTEEMSFFTSASDENSNSTSEKKKVSVPEADSILNELGKQREKEGTRKRKKNDPAVGTDDVKSRSTGEKESSMLEIDAASNELKKQRVKERKKKKKKNDSAVSTKEMPFVSSASDEKSNSTSEKRKLSMPDSTLNELGRQGEKEDRRKRRKDDPAVSTDDEKCKSTGEKKESSMLEIDAASNEFKKLRGKDRKKKNKNDSAVDANGEKNKDMKKNKKREVKISSIARKEGAADAVAATKSGEKSRKVSFAPEVKVFHLEPTPAATDVKVGELVQGKRFSPEEDEMIKQAVQKYIEKHSLGESGLEMILKCKKHPEIKGCWKEIAESLPWRPSIAIYCRGHTLFERNENHKWSPEEIETVRRFYEEHGPKWKKLGDMLSRHRNNCKDTWRRTRLPNQRKGHWSHEEYQSLFDLVNLDLKLGSLEEKKYKHGMIRDNIHWESICMKLQTRHQATCCSKWYKQLTSSMVSDNLWVDADDYRLIAALQLQTAVCIEEVEWDDLLEHRDGEICRKRWRQMVRHIGSRFKERSFIEELDILAKRYCPEMLEYRK